MPRSRSWAPLSKRGRVFLRRQTLRSPRHRLGLCNDRPRGFPSDAHSRLELHPYFIRIESTRSRAGGNPPTLRRAASPRGRDSFGDRSDEARHGFRSIDQAPMRGYHDSRCWPRCALIEQGRGPSAVVVDGQCVARAFHACHGTGSQPWPERPRRIPCPSETPASLGSCGDSVS
jgi:hypothetical protein